MHFFFYSPRLRCKPVGRIYSAEEELMNKRVKRLGFTMVLAMLVISLPAQMIPLKMCCIAGTYNGSQIHDPLPNCPAQVKEAFTMVIVQGRGCGAEVKGSITDTTGNTFSFNGALSKAPGGCCVFSASFADPAHPGYLVTLTGTFCLRLGKWHAKGTYKETNNSDPCKKSGAWQIQQV
jgi:hypothetical protein